jgi:uncharacterized protein YjbI with pentapeptide repeats
MDTRTIRRTSVTLPALGDPEVPLARVTSLEAGALGALDDFAYSDAELRDLDLADTRLVTGRISGISTQRTRLERLRVDSVEFADCDLASLEWTDSKLSRTVFRDCRLMGAVLEDVTLDNVLFENCRLDYGTLTRVRSTGPVIFSMCSLRETALTACELGSALVTECDIRLTEFAGGRHRGLDLRGNDLSQVRGLTSLKGIVIDRAQAVQLGEALTAELGIAFGDDPTDA